MVDPALLIAAGEGGGIIWSALGAIAGALVMAGGFLVWLIRYNTNVENRFTRLEDAKESMRAAILGLVEESKRDAERTRDFTEFTRMGVQELKFRISIIEKKIEEL